MSDIIAFTGPERRHLLDVGSGYGAFLLNARDHGFQVNGVEVGKPMAEFAATDNAQTPPQVKF
jgi:tRNA1(Val) A37 N6-methylase TrmN6